MPSTEALRSAKYFSMTRIEHGSFMTCTNSTMNLLREMRIGDSIQ